MTPEKIIEALVFVSENPLKPAQIAELFKSSEFEGMEMTEEMAKEILDGLVVKYETSETPWELRRIGGGYQFLSRKEYFPFLRSAVILKNQRKLSRAALETLSIIAYRQPVTRPEIEFIRGVNCDYAIQKLLEKNLVEISGRSDSAGKPLLYRTSQYFFEYFSINDIGDLPKLQEISIDEEEFQKQFLTFSEENDEMTKLVDEIQGENRSGDEPSEAKETEADIAETEIENEESAGLEAVNEEAETGDEIIESEMNDESFSAGEVDFSADQNPEDETSFLEDENSENEPITPE